MSKSSPCVKRQNSAEVVLNRIDFKPQLHVLNRQRLCSRMKAVFPSSSSTLLLFQGGNAQERHETDHEELFRQESNMAWAFGVKEPGVYGIVDFYNEKSYLVIPQLPEDYAIWMGPLKSKAWFKQEYCVDDVFFPADLPHFLNLLLPSKKVYTLNGGINTDTGRAVRQEFDPVWSSMFDLEETGLAYSQVVCELRVIKTELEIDLMREVNKASSLAHARIMQRIKPDMMEYQLEAMFQYETYFHTGCRHTSYTSICGCGVSASALHYGHAGAPNSRKCLNGEMCLLDMGAEARFYASDITNSFPVNGVFSLDQRWIYETVLAMQYHVLGKMKPGMFYLDLQEDTYRILCTRLKSAGLLKGDVEEMMRNNVGGLFQPHGLGHLLGVDTHDVGGKPQLADVKVKKRDELLGYKSLRLQRALREGMVEPGIYFIPHVLDHAMKDPVLSTFLVPARLHQFRNFGGVRLEDDVLVTRDGIENFTRCPRTVKDVEAWMKGTITDLNALDCPWTPKYQCAFEEWQLC